MGGHGGLNILPQKRWNVYNYSNRLQVERDRQKVEVKDRRKDEEESKSVGQLRLDILKRKQLKAEKKQKKYETEKPNALTQEFAQIVKQNNNNNNFNLFTEEEKYNDEKEESRAKFKKEQQLKEEEEPKPYDESTKFLGRQMENQANAWYLKHSGEETKDTSWIKNRRRQWGHIKEKGNELEESINNFHKQTENYYKILECKVEKKIKGGDDKSRKVIEQSKEKDVVVFKDLETMLKEKLRRKEEKKDKKRQKKLEKKLKKMEKQRLKQELQQQRENQEFEEQKIEQEFEEQEEKEKKKKLRQERLQREAIERQREKELFKKKFPFEFQY